MNSPLIRLSINSSVMGKASKADFYDLSNRLKPMVMSPEEIMQHLTIMGHPICCADLAVNDDGLCKREGAAFKSAQIIGVDIDKTSTPFAALKDDPWLKAHASFAYTTASHTEAEPRYRIMFVLPKPVQSSDEYRAIVAALIDKLGGDQNAKDNVRIWYGSVNAGTIIWGNVLSDRTVEALVRSSEDQHHEQRMYDTFSAAKIGIDDVRDMLRYIPPRPGTHIDWKKIAAAVFDAVGTGPDVIAMLEQWSPSEIPYTEIAKSGLSRVHAATLIWAAKRHGWNPRPGFYQEPPKSAVEVTTKVETFLQSGYNFRKNIVTNVIEYKSADSSTWERVTDYWINSECRRMRAAGLKITEERVYKLLDSDFSPMHDPIKDWFDSLEKWEPGDRDEIAALCSLIPPSESITSMTASAQQKYVLQVMQTWILGCVACALEHKPNHVMPILQGAQGVGKTTFLRHLTPKALRRDHYFEGMITGDKDNEIKLSQCFIVVDDELEGMTKKSVDLIKQTTSKDQHTIRHPYAHYHITVPRRVSFAGSVNKRTFLTDETGSRRFPVLVVGGVVDLEALQKIDIERLWAQALYLYKNGGQSWFDSEMNDFVQRQNQQFEATSMADDLVNTWCKKVEDDGTRPRMSATEIASIIQKKHSDMFAVPINLNAQFIRDVGRAMTRAGYEHRAQRHQGHLKSGYLVEILSTARVAYGSQQVPDLSKGGEDAVQF
jgi:hypothetical protein